MLLQSEKIKKQLHKSSAVTLLLLLFSKSLMLFGDRDKCFWIFWAWFYVHTYTHSYCGSAAPSFPWKQCRKGSCNRRGQNGPQWHCWEIKWNQNKLMTVMALVSKFETRATTTPTEIFQNVLSKDTYTHTHKLMSISYL